jgi:long-chain acyl-CoA synthetase
MNAFDYFFEFSKNLNKDFLIGSKGSVGYQQIYSQSLKFAQYLVSQIGKNNNVILISPNSSFFIIAYLGILKSDNIAVPLNPEIEQNNLDYIQDKCKSRIAIMNNHSANRLNIRNATILDENKFNTIASNEMESDTFTSDTLSDQLAEIIFTSGSTGEPKGVMISHKNLIANTSSIVEYLCLKEDDRMLVVLPFYYCYGLSLLHTHLKIGGSIVLNNMFIMLGGVINDLKRFNCTGFAGVPSHYQILLRKSDSFKTSHFPNLRYVTQAGGKLHNAFISEFIEVFPNIKFNVMYGQTEATARLSWLPPEMLPEKIGSCGKAIPGVQLKVLGKNGRLVTPGESGEILAYGDNIMQGYYKDQESTDQTIKNGWLHTGDLATVDDDGYIFLTARKKEIIKVGGRRVSPKEIEEVIVSMPEVIDCSIEAVYDEILGETMKASVVVKEAATSSVNSDTIKSWCASRLVPYKIPRIIELKDKVTISPTGKKLKK